MTSLEYDRKRAMKQTDFSKCLCCSKGMMHAGGMFFYRITIERMAVDVRAAQRQQGLEMMLGGHAQIASVMGENADMGLPIGDADVGLVCDECAIRSRSCIAQLSETMGERSPEETEAEEKTA